MDDFGEFSKMFRPEDLQHNDEMGDIWKAIVQDDLLSLSQPEKSTHHCYWSTQIRELMPIKNHDLKANQDYHMFLKTPSLHVLVQICDACLKVFHVCVVSTRV